MKSHFKPIRFSLALGTLMTFVILSVAPNRAVGQDLPSGESILAKYIEATGGQAAYDKIENRIIKANMEIVNAGIEFSMTIYAAKPNKVLVDIESDSLGKIQQGCTGKVVWSNSDMQGPVVEEGAALENRLRDSLFDRTVYWKKAYESAKCVALETVDGKECYKVVLTPKPFENKDVADDEPSSLTVYFDKNTYLPIKIESNVVTEAGAMDLTAYLSDYKTVDGIKICHNMKTELAGQTRVMTVQSVEQNVKLDANQFDPPAEIQALIKKKKDDKTP